MHKILVVNSKSTHHEVCFAEHLFNLVDVAIANQTSSWCTGVHERETGTKAQKTQCNGILKMKQSDSLNWRLWLMWLAISWTSFNIYKKKHKELSSRWSTCWNNATKLSSLEGSCPGGWEEKHQPQHSQQASNEDDPPPSKRAEFNSLVTTSISFESRQESNKL